MASTRALALQQRLPSLRHPADVQTAVLALCVWREARGESDSAKAAVAHVIVNRTKDPRNRWPKSIDQVVLQPWQFSSFNQKDPNVDKYPAATDASWNACTTAAAQALEGQLPDPGAGATHYFDNSIAPPKWADPAKQTAEIGRLRFYRL